MLNQDLIGCPSPSNRVVMASEEVKLKLHKESYIRDHRGEYYGAP